MMRGKTILLLSIGALALGAGVWLGDRVFGYLDEPPLEISGFYFPEPKEIDEFTLTHQSGRPFGKSDLKNAWTFIYFGYTHCPDACPMTLTELRVLEDRLAERGLNQDTAYLLISVDPERDTPQRLGEYTAYFHEKFQGATGSHVQLTELARQLGVIYRRAPGQEDEENYLVDHSSTLLLIDPHARLHAVFTPPHTPDSLLADFVKLREHYRPLN